MDQAPIRRKDPENALVQVEKRGGSSVVLERRGLFDSITPPTLLLNLSFGRDSLFFLFFFFIYLLNVFGICNFFLIYFVG